MPARRVSHVTLVLVLSTVSLVNEFLISDQTLSLFCYCLTSKQQLHYRSDIINDVGFRDFVSIGLASHAWLSHNRYAACSPNESSEDLIVWVGVWDQIHIEDIMLRKHCLSVWKCDYHVILYRG